jgi:predicted Zn-dependent protease
MKSLIRTRAAFFLAFALVLWSSSGHDARAASLIRDAEVENTIRTYATPLFETAGLNPRDVHIYIINNRTLNAFVAGGLNMFFNTGFLLKTRSASEVIGVIAHETGHLAGGHIARFSSQINTANRLSTLTTILGMLTAVATGRGDAGAAVAQGGQGLLLGNILAYSRGQESAADQAALTLLDRTGQSAAGLYSFLRTMENQEFLSSTNQDPYVRTHPLTRDRLRLMEDHLKASPYKSAVPAAELEERHRRIVAKLYAFIEHPTTVLRTYGAGDNSIAARYARAIAQYRVAALDKALPLIDALIAAEPRNPFFHELKGQMLFENGRIFDSVAPNAEATRLAPDEPLLRLGLARSQLELNDPALTKDAIRHLLLVTQGDPDYAFGWDQLALAYGRDGQLGLSALAQAEAALRRGRKKDALSHAARAEKRLDKASSAWLRLQDIKRAARQPDERR